MVVTNQTNSHGFSKVIYNMKKDKNIEKLNTYIVQGHEILDNKDRKNTDLLNRLKEQLDKLKNEKSGTLHLAAVFLSMLKEIEKRENDLKDLTCSYDEVLGLITHEFKNILTSIHGYNMMMETHLSREKTTDLFYHLMDSDRLTRQLFDMTDSLLKMSLGEKGLLKPELKLIDFVEDLIEPLKRDLENQLNIKKMKISLKQLTKNLIIECDETLLDVVIRNLLINAIKYGKENTDIVIKLSRSKNDFFVSVKNLSDDIPGDLCKGIFDKFKSRKIGAERGGTGIGLYNVKNIINLHQGNVTCDCLAGKWIEFTFNLPQKI